jgi:hypothetical protein
MNAIEVCVDMSDILQVTLPYNRHHFDQVFVVTSTKDAATEAVAKANNCQVFKTDSFWYKGSEFAKWRSLEEALRETGLQDSHEWLAILDADVLWPKEVSIYEKKGDLFTADRSVMHADHGYNKLEIGKLYGPYRRMWRDWPNYPDWVRDLGVQLPGRNLPYEVDWRRFPLSPQQTEWAGFSMIFHTDDPVLQQRPWFDVSWRSCSGADSFFQMRWEGKNKVRPPWEVLHLGEDHINWLGRTSMRADGTIPEGAAERRAKLREMMGKRRKQTDATRFDHEKIKD